MSQTQMGGAKGKPTPTEYPIHELIERRWSPRAFAPTPVEEEKLQRIFEAARWAPSSSNVQPWRFLLTRNGEESFSRLHGCLSEGNKLWTANVPLLLLSVTDTMFPAKGDKPARANPTAKHDLGLALANLTLQATALGLYIHPMAGFNGDKVREVFKVPAPYEPVTVSAIGYLADSNTLPDDLREREAAPRSRKSLREIVFEGDWGQPADFV